ncbi:MAG TPA: SpoIIE family protein phosphatase [Gaiellaceae bacterium]|nr:SpoIIE family protein phosphatase [Gaiellaceae bacterium]
MGVELLPGAIDELRSAYFAAVVATSSDAIVSKDLDGTVTSWNKSAERIFGYPSSEIVGKNIRLLIPPELQAEEDEIVDRLRSGGFIEHYETVRLTCDGRRLDVSLSISPIKNEAGEVIGAAKIARDITPRKLAEEQLRATTAKFESVFNQSGIFAGIMDLEGNLREVNALAVDSCGYTRDDVLDLPFWSTPWWRGSPETQAQVRRATRAALAGEEFRETLSYWVADGTERVVDFAMHPIRDDLGTVRFLYPTGIDVTDRTRAEEALRAQEAEEREIAVGLQRALLPGTLVVSGGVSVSARYEAASAALEVGGDWYDVFELLGGRVAVTVGDVVGHGLEAAAAMGQLRTALAALARYSDSPGELLTRLDAFVASTGSTDFATVCYGVLDPSTGRFEYASAGHPPILLISPSGETRLLDEAQSPPLYGEDDRARPFATAWLEPGSVIVCYSDGLIERRGEPLTAGLERLQAAARSLPGLPIDTACDSLVSALGVEESRKDDVAVLAVKLDPVRRVGFRHVFPAAPEELRGLRAMMRTWLQEHHVPEAERSALILAVGEACSNAIEHAYRGVTPGEVKVEIDEAADGVLEVTVRDFGRFHPPVGRSADRGRGTTLMRELTLDFDRRPTPTGTTIHFRLPMAVPGPV